jgi:histidinol-phosphate phosphatase family protein
MIAAIFFDKDGTLIDDVPYNVDSARIRLADGAAQAARMLREAGYRLFVVSNQSGVAHGYFDVAALTEVERRIDALLRAEGASLDGFYFCPHHIDGRVAEFAISCMCRKPYPGMLFQAAGEHDIDLSKSWMVGNVPDDVEAGRRAGCRTVLLLNGNETDWSPAQTPDFIIPNLVDAAAHILAVTGTRAATSEFPAEKVSRNMQL